MQLFGNLGMVGNDIRLRQWFSVQVNEGRVSLTSPYGIDPASRHGLGQRVRATNGCITETGLLTTNEREHRLANQFRRFVDAERIKLFWSSSFP